MVKAKVRIKGKLPVRFGVYAKIGDTKYQRHSWALTKPSAESLAKTLRTADVKGIPVTRISIKKLSDATVRSDIRKAMGWTFSSLPLEMKRLVRKAKKTKNPCPKKRRK